MRLFEGHRESADATARSDAVYSRHFTEAESGPRHAPYARGRRPHRRMSNSPTANSYTDAELRELGLGAVGQNVRVHRTVLFFGADKIHLRSNIRIDAYTVLTAGPGELIVGNHCHLAVGCIVYGGGGVKLEDFVGLSGRTIVYSTNDDYSGAALTGPTVAPEFTNITAAPVHVGKHVIVGAGTIILPGVRVGAGAAVGALSLVRADVPDFSIVAGAPARRIGERKRDLLDLEQRFLATHPLPTGT